MSTDGRRPLQIGPCSALPGARATGWLTFGQDWRRAELAVPVAVVHGREPGPVLYVQAVSDGDELNGLGVVRRLLAGLRPAELAGAVVAVPVANPGAFATGTASDPRDDRKLNRCFPGRPDGTLTERLAHHLLHELIVGCDLVVDLHQNGDVPMVPEVRVRTGVDGALHAECLELALAFALPRILDQRGPAGQLARVAPAMGIPTIDPELGGNRGCDEAMVELGLRGVRSVMRRYGLLAGEPETVDRPFIADRIEPVVTPVGGVVEFIRPLGALVREGEAIALVGDVFGADPVPVPAPADGLVWIQQPAVRVARGMVIAAVGVARR